MDQLDETIHQPVRLKIMAALKALPNREAIEFVRLRTVVGATEGNLGAHLTTLEKCGYIEITKDFVGKKPRTRIAMTTVGRRAFERYVDYLRGILDGSA
ncbi:MAG: transcriptional regulator [Paraburkholderia sp.]|jgi:DNA-binding MarR family transcriptional regulator|uniref:winged helix-turn-helix domain-containing protein n=1 Tax=Burkholderiaceae TaxID=119060 RepID=UPI0010F7265B|nr:transcriptional regulator [Burkholderia sp. 4M9327F10]